MGDRGRWFGASALVVAAAVALCAAPPAWPQKRPRRIAMLADCSDYDGVFRGDAPATPELQQPFRDCLARSRFGSATVSGDLRLDVRVGPEGNVKQVEVERASGLPESLVRCATNRQLAWHGPPPDGGNLHYAQPDVFLPGTPVERPTTATGSRPDGRSRGFLPPLLVPGRLIWESPNPFFTARPTVADAPAPSSEEALVLELTGRVGDCSVQRSGSVRIQTLVKPDGQIDGPTVTTDPPNRELGRCVSQALDAPRLPTHTGKEVWRVDLRIEAKDGDAWIIQ